MMDNKMPPGYVPLTSHELDGSYSSGAGARSRGAGFRRDPSRGPSDSRLGGRGVGMKNRRKKPPRKSKAFREESW